MEREMVSWGCKKRRISRVGKEDRISQLPDDLIHLILSKADATQIIRTGEISTRWRNMWKSLPHINFDRSHFSRLPDFSRFVARFLLNRDTQSCVSVINLHCARGSIEQALLKKIAAYAASHGAQQLNISSSVRRRGMRNFPLSMFACPSLQHLHLSLKSVRLANFPAWSLPKLTSLTLQDIPFQHCCDGGGIAKSIDIFSNLPYLKKLSLVDCNAVGLKVFKITSSSLENLTISGESRETKTCKYVISAPNLVIFNYHDKSPLLKYGGIKKAHFLVEFDIRRKELHKMMELLALKDSQWKKKKSTQQCDELKFLSKEIDNICEFSLYTLQNQWMSMGQTVEVEGELILDVK